MIAGREQQLCIQHFYGINKYIAYSNMIVRLADAMASVSVGIYWKRTFRLQISA